MSSTVQQKVVVCQLKNENYFVGRTSVAEAQALDYFNTNPLLYENPAIKILRIYYNITRFNEDTIVLDLMNKYGVERVRGGSYSANIFDDVTRQNLINLTKTCYCYICDVENKHSTFDCVNKYFTVDVENKYKN